MSTLTKCQPCNGYGISTDDIGWSMQTCSKCNGIGFYDPDKKTPSERTQEIIEAHQEYFKEHC